MNEQQLEQNIYFFMAYLAQKAAGRAFAIPVERAEYRLVKGHRGAQRKEVLQTHIRLDDVTLPVSTIFEGPYQPEDLERMAEEVADRLERFERDGREAVDEVSELRIHAERAFNKMPRKLGLKFVSLDLHLDDFWSPDASCLMTYEMHGPQTHRVTETAHIDDADGINAELAFHLNDQKTLSARAREFKKEGADGAIDVVLLAKLEELSIDAFSAIISAQALKKNDVVNLPDSGIRMFWKDGILTANFDLNPTVNWHAGSVTINPCPADVEGDMTGRKVRQVIDLALIPEELTFIRGTAKPGARGLFEAELLYVLFETASETTW